MMVGYIILNPNYNKSTGVMYPTFAITREACIHKWEEFNNDVWRDDFPNLKCSLVQLTIL
jgi:hypothetical protein